MLSLQLFASIIAKTESVFSGEVVTKDFNFS